MTISIPLKPKFRDHSLHLVLVVAMSLMMISCQSRTKPTTRPESVQSLQGAFASDFKVGAALGRRQILGENQKEADLIARQFNSVTPENVMKWIRIHPEPEAFDFELADQLVAIAEKNGQQIIGHTLIWHNQVPNWLFEDDQDNPVDSLVLYERMKQHIETVVGHYKGKISGWDVVNEALNGDGSFRESKFHQIAGEGYIFKAFEYAAEADPEMELYYNDYSMHVQSKVDGAIRLAKEIRARGLRIDGVGMQGHWGLDGPPISQIEQSIVKIHEAGLQVMITELDIDVLPNPRQIEGADLSENFANHPQADPFVDGLPDSVNEAHARRYEELFRLFLKHKEKISRVTFWGVHDGHSWKNNWPARGRTNYCLVFDRNQDPKLAYHTILALKE